jgi:hypothetical protein
VVSEHAAACAQLRVAAVSADYGELASVLRDRTADELLQQKGCRALARLLQRDGSAAREAAAAGCTTAVLLGLATHPGSMMLAEYGLEALCALTASGAGAAARTVARDSGGAAAALTALSAHGRGNEAAAAAALHVFCNLCSAESGGPPALGAVPPAEAARAVAEALTAHAGASPRVELFAAQALTHLSYNASSAAAALACGIAPLVSLLQSRAGSHEHVAARAATAVGSLGSRGGVGSAEAAGRAGAVAAVVTVMNGQPGSAGVHHHCAWALATLCAGHPANAARAAEAGAVHTLCASLRRHSAARPDIIEWDCRALIELLAPAGPTGGCPLAAAAAAADAAGALAGALRAAAAAHPPQAWDGAALYASWALAVLCWREGPLRAAAADAGCADDAQRLLAQRPGSEAAAKAQLLLAKLAEGRVPAQPASEAPPPAEAAAADAAPVSGEQGAAGTGPSAAVAPAEPETAPPLDNAPAGVADPTADRLRPAAKAKAASKGKKGPQGGCCCIQ